MNCLAGYEFGIAKAAVAARTPASGCTGSSGRPPLGPARRRPPLHAATSSTCWTGWAAPGGRACGSASSAAGTSPTPAATRSGGSGCVRRWTSTDTARCGCRRRLDGPDGWHYVGDPAIAVLGAHGVCGTETASAGLARPAPRRGRSTGASPRQPAHVGQRAGRDVGRRHKRMQPALRAGHRPRSDPRLRRRPADRLPGVARARRHAACRTRTAAWSPPTSPGRAATRSTR